MAFDESLAARIRQHLARRKSVEEKKMFGGVGFLLHGNMLVEVWKDSLIARLGPDEGHLALLEPHVKEFDITGRAGRCRGRRAVGRLDRAGDEVREDTARKIGRKRIEWSQLSENPNKAAPSPSSATCTASWRPARTPTASMPSLKRS